MDRRTAVGALRCALRSPVAAQPQQAGSVYRIGVSHSIEASPHPAAAFRQQVRGRISSVITRRTVLRAGAIGLLFAHRVSVAQPASIIRRVGWLTVGPAASVAYLLATLKNEMRDLGWEEGKNIEYRVVYADTDMSRVSISAREMISQNVEVIVVGNAPAGRAVQQATKTIPIVMANMTNPVGNGLVASLAKPGGNVTGISNLYDEVLGKLIGVLHEVMPGSRRFAILMNETNPLHPAFWAASQNACATLGLVPLRVVASTPAQLAGAAEEMIRQRAQAVVVVPDAMYLTVRARLQEQMQTTRLPVAYVLREHVVAGGLLSYGADLVTNYRRAAIFVDKILRGAKPADLPVQQASKFDLVINLKTAKALGVIIPQTLLLRADEVIQ